MQTIGRRGQEVAPPSLRHVASLSRVGTTSTASAAANAQQKLSQELQSIRERRNWLIHLLYVRQEYSNCLQVIEAQLRETEGTCEYALYVKGLLKRLDGALSESLELLQTAVIISPENAATRTQLGRALHLLGRHEDAIRTFQEAASIRAIKGLGADWEIDYNIGLCHLHRGHYRRAMDAFLQSITTHRHDCAYLQLGKAALLAQDHATALQVYEEAVTVSPANPDLLAMLGHLYLQQGNPGAAFDFLGRCLTIAPTHVDALVAASSIIQDNGDYDVALTKYRIVVAQQPDAAQVWNNIGACFIGKKMSYAAVACLRKSVFLYPFNWISHYNLGVVFLMLGRHCSALQCLNAAVHLHADYAPAYMLLGICLGEVMDLPNACRAYERALAMQDDFLVYLNYAVTLYKGGAVQEADGKLHVFRSVWDQLTPEQRREQSSAILGVLRHLEELLAPLAAPSDAARQTSAPDREPEREERENEVP
ncbi:Bardet-Biedl syndrome 4 protein [Novymonas esmeraldas]|uniref:Bardet-Biedl syndrome 4 protein n=1 Tax=Novymonas esmeraldas TaxID=1808958 RepID=A0AAW0F1H0_9TRYP